MGVPLVMGALKRMNKREKTYVVGEAIIPTVAPMGKFPSVVFVNPVIVQRNLFNIMVIIVWLAQNGCSSNGNVKRNVLKKTKSLPMGNVIAPLKGLLWYKGIIMENV